MEDKGGIILNVMPNEVSGELFPGMKLDGKNVTVKTETFLNWAGDVKNYRSAWAPMNKNLRYVLLKNDVTLGTEADAEEVTKHETNEAGITVNPKNGAVTVSKDYVVKGKSNDSYGVGAYSTDGTECARASGSFTIGGQTELLGDIVVIKAPRKFDQTLNSGIGGYYDDWTHASVVDGKPRLTGTVARAGKQSVTFYATPANTPSFNQTAGRRGQKVTCRVNVISPNKTGKVAFVKGDGKRAATSAYYKNPTKDYAKRSWNSVAAVGMGFYDQKVANSLEAEIVKKANSIIKTAGSWKTASDTLKATGVKEGSLQYTITSAGGVGKLDYTLLVADGSKALAPIDVSSQTVATFDEL